MTQVLSSPRNDAEQARIDAALTDHFRDIPFSSQVMGVSVTSVRLPHPTLRFEMKPSLVGTPAFGRLHGGAIAAMLDDAGGLAMHVAMADRHIEESLEQLTPRFTRSATIDLRIEYLRPGKGAFFLASAEITRFGSRIGSVLSRLVNDEGALVATGAANYVVS